MGYIDSVWETTRKVSFNKRTIRKSLSKMRERPFNKREVKRDVAGNLMPTRQDYNFRCPFCNNVYADAHKAQSHFFKHMLDNVGSPR